MDRLFSRLTACFLFLFPCVFAFSTEENFLLINGVTDEVVLELGPHIYELFTPCSTFKVVLSLMGYDCGILKDEKNPTWVFQEGYDDFLESWKAPQTPQSWMQHSCFWYSKVLAKQIGLENIQNYLVLLKYGNQDMSGGLTSAWVNSSLKISPKEQVDFLQKLIGAKLPVSSKAIQITKALLFLDELPEGWKLYGKTGWSGARYEQEDTQFEIGWFVGWIEKDQVFFPFAYQIREKKIALAQRIPRVKQLLAESNVLTVGLQT